MVSVVETSPQTVMALILPRVSYASVTENMNDNSRQLAQAETTTMDCDEAPSTELSRAQQALGDAGLVYQPIKD